MNILNIFPQEFEIQKKIGKYFWLIFCRYNGYPHPLLNNSHIEEEDDDDKDDPLTDNDDFDDNKNGKFNFFL